MKIDFATRFRSKFETQLSPGVKLIYIIMHAMRTPSGGSVEPMIEVTPPPAQGFSENGPPQKQDKNHPQHQHQAGLSTIGNRQEAASTFCLRPDQVVKQAAADKRQHAVYDLNFAAAMWEYAEEKKKEGGKSSTLRSRTRL